jgi:outer membrane protein
MNSKLTALMASLLVVSTSAVEADQTENTLSLGLGVIHFSDHYIGDNDETLLAPYFRYTKDRFSIGLFDGASYDFYSNDGLSVNARLVPRYTTLDGPDSEQLQGIDRKSTLDLGFGVDYMFGQSFVSASLLAEVTGKHDGFEIDLNIGRSNSFDRFSVTYVLGASWRSRDLADYQYGVRVPEALGDRPAYSADAMIVPYSEFSIEYSITEKWKVITFGQISLLTGDIKSSPIVESTASYGIFSALAREF